MDLVYGYAWFVGFFAGAGVYLAMMGGMKTEEKEK